MFPLQLKCKENQGCFPLSNSEIETLQSKWFSEMHQAGVVINFGWGPLLWLSEHFLVGKGWVFNSPFLLIMSGHYPVNLQLVILSALHSLQSQEKILNSWTAVQVTGFHVNTHEISRSLAAMLNDSQMRLFCDRQSHLQRKARYCWQQEFHFALRNIFSPSGVKGVCQELQTHDWQLGTITGQAAIPLGWNF